MWFFHPGDKAFAIFCHHPLWKQITREFLPAINWRIKLLIAIITTAFTGFATSDLN